MTSTITDKWIVKQIRKDYGFFNQTLFVYPRGTRKRELHTNGREKVCASVADILYVSTEALYLRDKAGGGYARLPWGDIDDLDWLLRKVDGRTVQAICVSTADGRRIVVPMPFGFIPCYFGEVIDECVRELTRGGKTCKLLGPARFESYARPVSEHASWAMDIRREKTVWLRELVCPCDSQKGFALRYLGQLRKGATIADGDLRQRIVADCKGCGKALELFDSYRNGYNSVICGEYKGEPPGREAKTPYTCRCGKKRFLLGVAAVYDADSEDLIGFRKEKRSEAYGWFTARATCRACKAVSRVVDYETA